MWPIDPTTGKFILGPTGKFAADENCCCDFEICPHCGTVIEDLSCGPYEGFTLFAFPFPSGPPVTFWGDAAIWEDVCCACAFVESTPVTINGACYMFHPYAHIAHYPFLPTGGTVPDDCQHLDIVGKTIIDTFSCGHSPCLCCGNAFLQSDATVSGIPEDPPCASASENGPYDYLNFITDGIGLCEWNWVQAGTSYPTENRVRLTHDTASNTWSLQYIHRGTAVKTKTTTAFSCVSGAISGTDSLPPSLPVFGHECLGPVTIIVSL